MLKTVMTKILSILTSVTLLIPSFAGNAGAIGASPAAFAISIPPSLGFISESYSPTVASSPENVSAEVGRRNAEAGSLHEENLLPNPAPRIPRSDSRTPDVILIQDLHVNRSVQFAISKILKHLKTQGLMPDHIAVEGTTGPVDIASMQRFPDPTIRKKAADYLVEQGEMPGDMHYAVTEGEGGLFGIETDEYYQANLEMFRRSYKERANLRAELEKIRTVLPKLKKDPTIKDNALILEKDIAAVSELINNQVTRDDMYSTLRQAAEAVEHLKMVLPNLNAEPGTRNVTQQPVIATTASSIRHREAGGGNLSRSRQNPKITTSAQPMKDGGRPPRNDDKSKDLIDSLSSSINFYALALLRDEELFKNLLSARELGRQKTSIVVVGGFHTQGLTEQCKRRGLGYVVITPDVKRHDKIDENLYVERLLGHHLTPQQVESGLDWAALEGVPRQGRAAMRTIRPVFDRVVGVLFNAATRFFTIGRLKRTLADSLAALQLGMAASAISAPLPMEIAANMNPPAVVEQTRAARAEAQVPEPTSEPTTSGLETLRWKVLPGKVLETEAPDKKGHEYHLYLEQGHYDFPLNVFDLIIEFSDDTPVGTHFRVYFKREHLNETYLNHILFTVPEERLVIVTVYAADFGLTPEIVAHGIRGIGVVSGQGYEGETLHQDESMKAGVNTIYWRSYSLPPSIAPLSTLDGTPSSRLNHAFSIIRYARSALRGALNWLEPAAQAQPGGSPYGSPGMIPSREDTVNPLTHLAPLPPSEALPTVQPTPQPTPAPKAAVTVQKAVEIPPPLPSFGGKKVIPHQGVEDPMVAEQYLREPQIRALGLSGQTAKDFLRQPLHEIIIPMQPRVGDYYYTVSFNSLYIELATDRGVLAFKAMRSTYNKDEWLAIPEPAGSYAGAEMKITVEPGGVLRGIVDLGNSQFGEHGSVVRIRISADTGNPYFRAYMPRSYTYAEEEPSGQPTPQPTPGSTPSRKTNHAPIPVNQAQTNITPTPRHGLTIRGKEAKGCLKQGLIKRFISNNDGHGKHLFTEIRFELRTIKGVLAFTAQRPGEGKEWIIAPTGSTNFMYGPKTKITTVRGGVNVTIDISDPGIDRNADRVDIYLELNDLESIVEPTPIKADRVHLVSKLRILASMKGDDLDFERAMKSILTVIDENPEGYLVLLREIASRTPDVEVPQDVVEVAGRVITEYEYSESLPKPQNTASQPAPAAPAVEKPTPQQTPAVRFPGQSNNKVSTFMQTASSAFSRAPNWLWPEAAKAMEPPAVVTQELPSEHPSPRRTPQVSPTSQSGSQSSDKAELLRMLNAIAKDWRDSIKAFEARQRSGSSESWASKLAREKYEVDEEAYAEIIGKNPRYHALLLEIATETPEKEGVSQDVTDMARDVLMLMRKLGYPLILPGNPQQPPKQPSKGWWEKLWDGIAGLFSAAEPLGSKAMGMEPPAVAAQEQPSGQPSKGLLVRILNAMEEFISPPIRMITPVPNPAPLEQPSPPPAAPLRMRGPSEEYKMTAQEQLRIFANTHNSHSVRNEALRYFIEANGHLRPPVDSQTFEALLNVLRSYKESDYKNYDWDLAWTVTAALRHLTLSDVQVGRATEVLNALRDKISTGPVAVAEGLYVRYAGELQLSIDATLDLFKGANNPPTNIPGLGPTAPAAPGVSQPSSGATPKVTPQNGAMRDSMRRLAPTLGMLAVVALSVALMGHLDTAGASEIASVAPHQAASYFSFISSWGHQIAEAVVMLVAGAVLTWRFENDAKKAAFDRLRSVLNGIHLKTVTAAAYAAQLFTIPSGWIQNLEVARATKRRLAAMRRGIESIKEAA